MFTSRRGRRGDLTGPTVTRQRRKARAQRMEHVHSGRDIADGRMELPIDALRQIAKRRRNHSSWEQRTDRTMHCPRQTTDSTPCACTSASVSASRLRYRLCCRSPPGRSAEVRGALRSTAHIRHIPRTRRSNSSRTGTARIRRSAPVLRRDAHARETSLHASRETHARVPARRCRGESALRSGALEARIADQRIRGAFAPGNQHCGHAGPGTHRIGSGSDL